jgi:hypothetical protein
MSNSRKGFSLTLIAVITIAVNLLIGVYAIDSIPPGHTYDEIIYLGEAQSLLNYGSNLDGDWHPLMLQPADGYYAELTSSMLVPGFILFPDNPILASKFSSILLGAFVPILLALMVFYFYRSRLAIITVAVVTTLNPWIFQFTRMSFDSLFSIVFYLTGMVILLLAKSWTKVFSVLFFFIGFYQYQGHKPILVPLVGLVVLALVLNKTSFTYPYTISRLKSQGLRLWKSLSFPALAVLFFTIFLTASYLFRIDSLTTQVRSKEYLVLKEEIAARRVDELRRLSLHSSVSSVFINKATVISEVLMYRLFESFNPRILFLSGNKAVDTFALTDYGFFHKHDLFLLCIFPFLIARYRDRWRIGLFLIIFSLIGALPNLIRDGDIWITFRGAFAFLGLALMTGVSLFWMIQNLQVQHRILLLCLYTLLATPFLYFYFNTYPIAYGAHTGFYERVLANYVQRAQDSVFYIIVDRTDATFDYITTYNKLYDSPSETLMGNTSKTIRTVDNGRITITSQCPKNWGDIDPATIIIVDSRREPCAPVMKNSAKIEIKSTVDSGTMYSIYNDTLCDQYVARTYPDIESNIFSVEKLPTDTFCNNFFMRP